MGQEGLLCQILPKRYTDKVFAKSHDVLAELATAALAEDQAGKTQELDPETL